MTNMKFYVIERFFSHPFLHVNVIKASKKIKDESFNLQSFKLPKP